MDRRAPQARLRAYLAGRIDQVRQQAAEMGTFERQLQAVLDRLSARDSGPEHCGRGCVCEAERTNGTARLTLPADPEMITSVAALSAAGLVLLLWATGYAVTAAGNRIPPAQDRSRHYLAGVFRITARTCSLGRVRRWHHESTPLRAYLSHDGAIMLADPALGGNAPGEPSATQGTLAPVPEPSGQGASYGGG